ncbi:MAG: peptidoglycan recognition family protein [Planctomycetota bacterium]|nr:peptidoglycan recognition family protein [Planctomycetota bacterium]
MPSSARPSRSGWFINDISRPILAVSWLLSVFCLVLVSGCGGGPPRRTPVAQPAALLDARAALEQGQIAHARHVFSSLESPERPLSLRGMARIGLGRCAIAENDLDGAIRHLDVARKLLPGGSQNGRARLYLGEAQLRSGAINTGLNHLENAFESLRETDDRRRAAFLITRTLDHIGDTVPALYRTAAGTYSYPEYSSIWIRQQPVPPAIVAVPHPPKGVVPVEKLSALPRLMIHKRSSWKARPVITRWVAPMSRPTRITVHHTADQPTIATLGIREPEVYLRRIQKYCTSSLEWGDIGYHYLISSDGRIWEGRPLKYQGAHAGNHSLNRGNIGVALIGNFDQDRPSSSQVRSLGSLLNALSSVHDIRSDRIYGHQDLRDTGCPGVHLQAVLSRLVSQLNRTSTARKSR